MNDDSKALVGIEPPFRKTERKKRMPLGSHHLGHIAKLSETDKDIVSPFPNKRAYEK